MRLSYTAPMSVLVLSAELVKIVAGTMSATAPTRSTPPSFGPESLPPPLASPTADEHAVSMATTSRPTRVSARSALGRRRMWGRGDVRTGASFRRVVLLGCGRWSRSGDHVLGARERALTSVGRRGVTGHGGERVVVHGTERDGPGRHGLDPGAEPGERRGQLGQPGGLGERGDDI